MRAHSLDENRFSYTLNTLSWHFLNEGKNERALNEAAKSRGLDAKADMWRLPAQVKLERMLKKMLS